MAYEIINRIGDYTSTPGLLGASLERGSRERMQRDQMAAQAALNEQMRLEQARQRAERVREFNARAAEWAGPDAVAGPDGIDIAATAKARQARMDQDALMGARGVASIVDPPRVPDRFAGPWQGEDPTQTPVIPPSETDLANPAFLGSMVKEQEKVKTAQDLFEAQRKLAKERAVGIAGAGVQRSNQKTVDAMDKNLRLNDPGYTPEPYFTPEGQPIQEAIDRLTERHAEVMPKITFGKTLPPSGRLAMKAPEDLAALGVTPEQQAKVETAVAGGNRLTAMQKNAKEYETELRDLNKSAAMPLTDAQILQKKQKFVENNGKLPTVPPKILTNLDADFSTLDTMDTLFNGVKAFENKYGKDSFASYLGWLPKNQVALEGAVAKATDPKTQEALQLLSTFSGMRNGVLATRSGQAVTEPENKRMSQEIGDVGDKNSLTRLAKFRENKARGVKGAIVRNYDYQLPGYYREWVNSELGGKEIILPTDVTAPAASAPVKSGRFTIEVEP